MKSVEYSDLEDTVFRLELTYSEITEILDTKYISTSSIGNKFRPGIYNVSDLNLMLKSLLPDLVEVSVTINDFRLILNLTSNKTEIVTEKLFFHKISGFTH